MSLPPFMTGDPERDRRAMESFSQQEAQRQMQYSNMNNASSPSSSPFANSVRQPLQNVQQSMSRRTFGGQPNMGGGLGGYGGPQQAQRARQQNPFEGNEAYTAMMDYQKTMRPNEDQRTQMQSLMDAMQPNQEQRDRMGELRTAFEGTGGFKDYRIQQMEQQLQQRQRQNPRMGMGLGSQRPQGMGMFGGFPQVQQRQPQGIMGGYGGGQRGFGPNPNNFSGGMQGGYGGMNRPQQPQQPQQQMPQPTYQPYQNPYQQQSPQPQQYGGYGMGQSQGGFGGYGGMSNPYQPQQQGQQQQPQRSQGYPQPMY